MPSVGNSLPTSRTSRRISRTLARTAWSAGSRIDRATFISEDNAGGTPIFKGVGWVAFSKLGIEELNEQASIRAAPAQGAHVLLTMPHTDGPAVPAEALGCDATFLKVKVSGVVGWTQSFCSNQFTTCN